MSGCNACPRRCGVDRTTAVGACGVGAAFRVARMALHAWEEPCISGKSGSGAIFFSGCPLKCVFCQNMEISRGCKGVDLTEDHADRCTHKHAKQHLVCILYIGYIRGQSCDQSGGTEPVDIGK